MPLALTLGLVLALPLPAALRPAARPIQAATARTEAADLIGVWTFRGFRDDTDLRTPLAALEAGVGELFIHHVRSGRVTGRLSFGSTLEYDVEGELGPGPRAMIAFRATRTGRAPTPDGTSDDALTLEGFVLKDTNGLRMVGTVVYASGPATWMALRQPSAAAADVPELARTRGLGLRTPNQRYGERTADAALLRLRASTEAFYGAAVDDRDRRGAPGAGGATLLGAPLPLAEVLPSAERSFRSPNEVHSKDGALETELTVAYAQHRIGSDPVLLRSYDGELVGPTLRVRPGDRLEITLRNELPPEPDADHPLGTGDALDPNGMHGWNTTNLHTHGLHVSPEGNSDNVFLEVAPGETQQYVIEIPEDHACGTFWYHAHKHGAVAAQVSSGLGGALVVEGGIDDLPGFADLPERVLVLQQIGYYKGDLAEGVIELPYADEILCPGCWGALGRFTTINGVVQPVMTLRPGEVQRWRMVHAGVRENLNVVLVDATGGRIALHELAVDGLPLGRLEARELVTLWPGGRSDVLVQAPLEPGTYRLVDEASAGADSLLGGFEPRDVLAVVQVAGAPMSGELPTDDLQRFRLPSVTDEELTGAQSVEYGILFEPLRFTVDRAPYNPARDRTLTLGDVEEWTLRSVNGHGAPIAHPFHIHVNPFEVVSMVDDRGRETLDAPVWRDTLLLPGNWTARVRSRYEDFAGAFVDHCHILDHEDNGMMEKVVIVDPDDEVRDARGPSGPDRIANGAALVVFFRGVGCPSCMEQLDGLSELAPRLTASGLELVCVSGTGEPDDPTRVGAFRHIVDEDYALHRRFGAWDDGALHALVLLDRSGAVLWREVGDHPFDDFGAVLARAREFRAR